MNKPLAAALEILTPHLRDTNPSQALIAAKVIGLLKGYAHRWNDNLYRIDEVESVLTSDLYNPETNRKSRSFTIAGKLDVRATEIATGQRLIFDHKTTSDDIADPASDYWRKLVVEGQPSHYFLLEWLNGERIDRAVWNCIKRPGISPKAVAKKDAESFLRDYEYCGTKFDENEVERFVFDYRETNSMYMARLTADCSFDRPEFYFQRRSVPRLESEIRDHALDLWDHAQSILNMRQNERYPRISAACMLHNSPCTYLGLCSGHDTQDSGKWQKKDWVHPELVQIGEGRGTDIITNSRVQTLICPQKHYLKYEVGLERVDDEEREVIYFGNLMHEGLERYYLALKEEQTR